MRTAAITIGLLIGLTATAGAQSLYGTGRALPASDRRRPEQGQVTPAILVLPTAQPGGPQHADLGIGLGRLRCHRRPGGRRHLSEGGRLGAEPIRRRLCQVPLPAGRTGRASPGCRAGRGGRIHHPGRRGRRRPGRIPGAAETGAVGRGPDVVGHLGVEYLGTLDGIVAPSMAALRAASNSDCCRASRWPARRGRAAAATLRRHSP